MEATITVTTSFSLRGRATANMSTDRIGMSLGVDCDCKPEVSAKPDGDNERRLFEERGELASVGDLSPADLTLSRVINTDESSEVEETGVGSGLIPETFDAVTAASFAKATAEGLSVVFVWASWCALCDELVPALKAIERSPGRRVRVLALDAMKEETLVAQLDVPFVPALVLYSEGKELARADGLGSPDALIAILENS